MNAPARDDRRGALPRGLLGMIGLVIAVELGLAHHERSFMEFYTFDWVVSGRAARQRAPACEILCFGDSLVKFGLAPRVLEERLGKRTYNLAVCGGQAPSSYFLLRRALESGARPTALIVDFMPHLLDHGPRQNLRQWPVLVDLQEFLDLAWSSCNASFTTTLALDRLLASSRSRFEIRGDVLAALRGERTHTRAPLAAFERNWRVNDGAQLSAKTAPLHAHYDLKRWEDFPRAWSCHFVNAAYLRRFFELAAQHQIPVFWLLPPTSPEVQARREQIGVDARYRKFVLTMQERFPNVTIVDGRHAGFGRELFLDPLHLNSRGAAALSTALAEVVHPSTTVRAARGPRWIELPDLHDVPIASRLEDIEQSKSALQLVAREQRR